MIIISNVPFSLFSQFHPQTFHQKRPQIGGFFDSFAHRHAAAVAGAGFDADQDRVVARLGLLHGGDEFETVAGYYAIVGVGRCDKRGRIARAGLDVVIRRIGINRLELLGVIRASRNPRSRSGLR